MTFRVLARGLALSGVAVLLGGCVGPLVRVEKVDPAATARVQVYPDNSILERAGVKSLGIVEATSCKNLITDPPSSMENCTAQMQVRASRIGANGLIVGGSEKRSANFVSTGINRNCWTTVDCSGIAIIVPQP